MYKAMRVDQNGIIRGRLGIVAKTIPLFPTLFFEWVLKENLETSFKEHSKQAYWFIRFFLHTDMDMAHK